MLPNELPLYLDKALIAKQKCGTTDTLPGNRLRQTHQGLEVERSRIVSFGSPSHECGTSPPKGRRSSSGWGNNAFVAVQPVRVGGADATGGSGATIGHAR